MFIIIRLLVSVLGLLAVDYLIPGIDIDSLYIALIVAVLLGLANLILRPILILLTLPINILTLGLFTFIINGLLFWFVASFVEGFSVDGFLTAVIGALALSILNLIGNKVFVEKEDR